MADALVCTDHSGGLTQKQGIFTALQLLPQVRAIRGCQVLNSRMSDIFLLVVDFVDFH